MGAMKSAPIDTSHATIEWMEALVLANPRSYGSFRSLKVQLAQSSDEHRNKCLLEQAQREYISTQLHHMHLKRVSVNLTEIRLYISGSLEQDDLLLLINTHFGSEDDDVDELFAFTAIESETYTEGDGWEDDHVSTYSHLEVIFRKGGKRW